MVDAELVGVTTAFLRDDAPGTDRLRRLEGLAAAGNHVRCRRTPAEGVALPCGPFELDQSEEAGESCDAGRVHIC